MGSGKQSSASLLNRKKPAFAGFFHSAGPGHKPNSVADDHLSGSIVTDTLERRSRTRAGTALHSGKDLAVSVWRHRQPILPGEDPSSFDTGRFCSHLAPYSGQALPATVLQH